MVSRSNKKTKKWWLPQLNITRKVARASIVVLVFMNIGVFFVALSSAASLNTQFIIFCAKDKCQGNPRDLDSQVSQVNTWFGQQTGKTFSQISHAYVVYGQQNASYYNAGYSVGSREATDNTFYRIYLELYGRGVINPSTRVVAQLGFRSMANCGVSSYNTQLSLSDPFKGWECVQNHPAILAHELGHTMLYGGTVDNSGHLKDGTLMHTPMACNYTPLANCSLNAFQKATIGANPWMNIPYGKPVTSN